MDTDHSAPNLPNKNHNEKVAYIKKEIDNLERRLQQRVQELRQELEEIEKARLVSPQKAAEILGITVEAVRKRAARGTLTKRNADGSKKITNRRTEIFFDEQEVRNKV